MSQHDSQALYRKIKELNELLWENRVTRPAVDKWLANFSGASHSLESERANALYLLSRFLYFGRPEVRELLRAMFQDLIRHRLTVEIRSHLPDKDDFTAIHNEFRAELDRTRFLGLGNPAESGNHILYNFRLVNALRLDLFVHLHELFTKALNDTQSNWAFPDVDRLIFIDDFCGTGSQAADAGRKYLPVIRQAASRSNTNVDIWYLTMLATENGLDHVRSQNLFNRVESVSVLDGTYQVFNQKSQVYANPPADITKDDAEAIAHHYGKLLLPPCPLGYGDSQLLLGFHHNVPDNTLPIFWQDLPDVPWFAIFPRDTKVL